MSTVYFHRDYVMIADAQLNAVSAVQLGVPELEDMAYTACVI